MVLKVDASGHVICLFSELLDLKVFGKLKIERVSHVEPTEGGEWLADMSPVNGPILGPFDRRSAALAAECEWLETNRL